MKLDFFKPNEKIENMEIKIARIEGKLKLIEGITLLNITTNISILLFLLTK